MHFRIASHTFVRIYWTKYQTVFDLMLIEFTCFQVYFRLGKYIIINDVNWQLSVWFNIVFVFSPLCCCVKIPSNHVCIFNEVLKCSFSPYSVRKPFEKSNKKWRIIWLINSTLSESYNWKSIDGEECKLKIASVRFSGLTLVRMELRIHT